MWRAGVLDFEHASEAVGAVLQGSKQIPVGVAVKRGGGIVAIGPAVRERSQRRRRDRGRERGLGIGGAGQGQREPCRVAGILGLGGGREHEGIELARELRGRAMQRVSRGVHISEPCDRREGPADARQRDDQRVVAVIIGICDRDACERIDSAIGDRRKVAGSGNRGSSASIKTCHVYFLHQGPKTVDHK